MLWLATTVLAYSEPAASFDIFLVLATGGAQIVVGVAQRNEEEDHNVLA